MATIAAWSWALGYDYLAHVWLEGPLRLHDDALGPWLEGIAGRDTGLSRDAADLARDAADLVRCLDDPAELEVASREFQSCVVVPLPGRYVPPYASVYLDASKSLWGAITTQVLSWYDEADLDWAGHSSRHPWVRAPDHLGVECAFAAELWAASDGSGPPMIGLGRAFLAGHLLEWVPQYATEMRDQVTSSYWQAITGFLERWVHESALSVSEATEPRAGDRATDGVTGFGDR